MTSQARMIRFCVSFAYHSYHWLTFRLSFVHHLLMIWASRLVDFNIVLEFCSSITVAQGAASNGTATRSRAYGEPQATYTTVPGTLGGVH